jgi:hypothetical protein
MDSALGQAGVNRASAGTVFRPRHARTSHAEGDADRVEGILSILCER